VVRELAGQLVKENLGQYTEQTQANDFVSQNRAWLFDEGGRRLSPWGEMFRGAVQEAAEMGLGSVEAQQKYAMRAVQAAYAAHVLQGQPPPAAPAAPAAPADPNAAAKAAYLAGAQRRPAAPAAQHQPAQALPAQPAP